MRIRTLLFYLIICFQFGSLAFGEEISVDALAENITVATKQSPFFVDVDQRSFNHPLNGPTKVALVHLSTQARRDELMFRVTVSKNKIDVALVRPDQSVSTALDFLQAEFEFSNELLNRFETSTGMAANIFTTDPVSGLKNGLQIESTNPVYASKEFNQLLTDWLGRYQISWPQYNIQNSNCDTVLK